MEGGGVTLLDRPPSHYWNGVDRSISDISIDTKRCTEKDVLVRAASKLGLYRSTSSAYVDVLVGGQYGSEGKGNIVSYLAKDYDLLVRVGGPNAGHKVYFPPYTFHLLPSGTLHSDAKLLIGPGAVINIDTLLREISDCHVDTNRLSIDPQVMVITPEDIKKEERLKKEIGSTGQGVGAATVRRIKRIPGKVKLAQDYKILRPYIKSAYEVLEKSYSQGQRILFEGTQGTALSLYHGHYPHVTSRDTTVAGCLAEAGISPIKVRKVVMVCRTYPIRVQSPDGEGKTSGWMSQETTLNEISRRSKVKLSELKKTEITSTTKRKRRIAEFDWALLRKASVLNSPTDIALTFADYIDAENKKARRFEQLTQETIHFIEEVERVSSAPVSLISNRFHHRNIIDRRLW
jgi:adenylosuccinate synthase